MGKLTKALRSLVGAKKPFVHKFPDIPVHAVPGGTYRQSTYVYYGSPIADIPLGRNFTVEVLPGVWQMRSEYTGGRWEGEGAIAYNGRPIGFVGEGVRSRTLMRLLKTYGRVSVQARKTGISGDGWPVVVLMMPKRWEGCEKYAR